MDIVKFPKMNRNARVLFEFYETAINFSLDEHEQKHEIQIVLKASLS